MSIQTTLFRRVVKDEQHIYKVPQNKYEKFIEMCGNEPGERIQEQARKNLSSKHRYVVHGLNVHNALSGYMKAASYQSIRFHHKTMTSYSTGAPHKEDHRSPMTLIVSHVH